MLGSDREGLGLGLEIRIADLNQIADLKLSILVPVCRSEPNTVLVYALTSIGSRELTTELKKKFKTTGMTRGPTHRHFQGSCREAKQR